MQEAPGSYSPYSQEWQHAVDEKLLALETDTVTPLKPQYEETAKESRFIKAPTIEIETPSSSSASSSDDEESKTLAKEADEVGDKDKESSSSESEDEDKKVKIQKREKSSSSSSSSDEDEKDKHKTVSESHGENEVKVEPTEHKLQEGETDLDAVMLKTEEKIITSETVTLETVEVEEPEYDSNLDEVIKELKKIEKGELPELPPGYHLDDKQDSIMVENVITSETTQIESSEIILEKSKAPMDKGEKDKKDKDKSDKSSSSSSSSDDEEYFEASAETPDRDKVPKYKTPVIAESASLPDQSEISELSVDPDQIRSEPSEEFITPPKFKETDRTEPQLTSKLEKKKDEGPVDDKHTQKKKVTFVEPDKSDSSESDSDSTTKGDDKSSSSDSDSEDQGKNLKSKEDTTVHKSDEDKSDDILTTDLDADLEDNEPKLLSYSDQSEPHKDAILANNLSEKTDVKEKERSDSSSSSSSESEDSDNEPTSYDINKDSSHSSSDDEQEKSEIISSEVRNKGTIVTEMIEVTQVSKEELVEGETDLDAVMLSPETKIDSEKLEDKEEAEVDTSLDTVIRELKKIEKGELPELPPGYEAEHPIIISESSQLKSTKDKDTDYIEIPKHPERPLIETNIDDLVEELEETVKSSGEKERKTSSSSESDGEADKEKKIVEAVKPGFYKSPDMGSSNEIMVKEQDAEMKIDEPVVLDDQEKFICVYPVPDVAPRAESPELIPVSVVTEGVPDDKERRSSTSSSSSSDHGDSGQPIIIKEEKPWQCIYPIPPSSETTEQEPERQPDDDSKEKIPSRKSSTSSSSSSDSESKDIKPVSDSVEKGPDGEEKAPDIDLDKPIIVKEEKPWQCIYPMPKTSEVTEQPEFREEEPHEISVDDQPIIITEEKPWQCIYPIAPEDLEPTEAVDEGKDSSSSESEADVKERNLIELEKMEKEKSSSSSSSSDDEEEENKAKQKPDAESKKQPEFKDDEPHEISVGDQPIIITEEKPWQCIYPIAPEDMIDETAEKRSVSSSESDTGDKVGKLDELEKIEHKKERSSSSSSSSDEGEDKQEPKTGVITDVDAWRCVYPIEPKPKLEFTERLEFREDEPHEISVDDQPIDIKEEKPWQCIYPIAPSSELTEQPEGTKGEPDEQIKEKVPSRKASTSSSSSSDQDETVPKKLPIAEKETTRVESIIEHDKPPVIKKSDITKSAVDADTENQKSLSLSSSSSSGDEEDVKDDKLKFISTVSARQTKDKGDELDKMKFITTVSAHQAKEKPLVTDLDAETTEPIRRKSSSSSSDEESKVKPPVTDLDEDVGKTEEPSDSVRDKSRSRSSSESSSSSSDDDKEKRPDIEEPTDNEIPPKSLETDLDADEPGPDTDEMRPKEDLDQSRSRSSSESSSSSSEERRPKREEPDKGGIQSKSLETDLDADEPKEELETDIDAAEPEPIPAKVEKPKHLPVSDMMETDLDAPDDDIVPTEEPVVECIEPLHSPDVGFAPKHYPEMPFETNVDTMEPEYTAYSIKSAIPVETPEGEVKPPEDEVYCETSFTVVRRTKVKQTYASDKTERQPTMVEQALQQSGKTPAITDVPDTAGKRHRTESLSDEEAEEHPSKRQEIEPAGDLVFGEDQAAPPAREYILVEPTILQDKTEVRTEHYRKEMPYVPADDASAGDDLGILFA